MTNVLLDRAMFSYTDISNNALVVASIFDGSRRCLSFLIPYRHSMIFISYGQNMFYTCSICHLQQNILFFTPSLMYDKRREKMIGLTRDCKFTKSAEVLAAMYLKS